MPKDRLDSAVGHREELLELVVGKCSSLWATFMVDQVRERVPLVTDLLRCGSEALFAVGCPPVPRIGEVVAEQTDDGVVSPDRRGSRRALPGLRLRREVLHLTRRPLPWVAAGELLEPPDDELAAPDGPLGQSPIALLITSPRKHRLEYEAPLVQRPHVAELAKG